MVSFTDWPSDGKTTGNAIDALPADPAPGSKVTRVAFGFTLAEVGPNGTDLAANYGTLHIARDGSYTYTRTAGNLWDGGAPSPGAVEKFAFEIRDGSGATSVFDFAIDLLSSSSPVFYGGSANGFDNDESITLSDAVNQAYGNGGQDRIQGANQADLIDGGAGNDWLIGGGGDDRLEGGDGVDRIEGGAGKDTIVAGAGADIVIGGADVDTMSFRDSAGLTVDLMQPALNTGEAKGDSYTGIEIYDFSEFSDSFAGRDVAETVKGHDGDDKLSGRGGDDQLFGHGDQDALEGGAGNDRLDGGSGNDALNGGTGDDDLVGGSGIDALDGGDGNDRLAGDAGDDTLAGGIGRDDLDGGAGNDELDGGDGNDGLIGAAGDDALEGGAGNDQLTGNDGDDALEGGGGGDLLWGDIGADTLDGGDGIDTLRGGTGNDTLKGGLKDDALWGDFGDDTLAGGAEADTFAWKVSEFGKDKVTDFKLGTDILAFHDVVDGAGSEIQDLVDAGFTASSKGSTLTVGWHGGDSQITIGGWTGGTVNSIVDLGQALGSTLVVEH